MIQTDVQPAFSNWFSKNQNYYDAVIFDVDGVLLSKKRPTPNSVKLLQMLRSMDYPFFLLTNDANHSIEEKAEYLQNAGIEVDANQIISCGHGLSPFVNDNSFKGNKFFIMGDLGKPCFAELAGITPVRDLEQIYNCKGVIIGEDNYDWESGINAVVNFFIDTPDALLVCPNPDEFYPGNRLTIQIAAGGVARFIQQVTSAYGLSVTPIYLGKPYEPIFQQTHKRLEKDLKRKISLDRVIMVGDNLDADIKGANDYGYRSVLVLTGISDEKMLTQSHIKPDLIFRTL